MSQLSSAAGPDFERLARTLLRLALAPPDRLLGEEDLQAAQGGYRVEAGESRLPVFVQLIAFQERSEDLGEEHVRRCREAIAHFTNSPLQAEAYLLVYNRDPRSRAFRTDLEGEIVALRSSGRVKHALVWGVRNLIEAAFDGLYDLALTQARAGSLSVAPVDTALATSPDVLTEVPLRISQLTADQHRLGADEAAGTDMVADPAALLLAEGPTVRTFLLGSFGFGKTTAVARSLLQRDVQVLYVPGSVITQEVATAKVLLARCINPDPLFPDCAPEARKIYERMLRAVVEHLFKDPNLPCALILDGLDESPFLCRGAGLQHLLNNLETVRIPLILAMRSEYWRSRRNDLESTAGQLQSKGEPRKRILRKLELLPWRHGEILDFVHRFRQGSRDPVERERLGELEDLVAAGRFEEIYGDIPRRPLFLRLIAESAAALGLPGQRIGRARLFHDWVLWKIRRDLRVARPHLTFPGEPGEEVETTVWEAMLHAAASMTRPKEGALDLLPECSFDRLCKASERLGKLTDVLALTLQSLLVLSRERTAGRPARVEFAHRAYQEFFLAWFLAERFLEDHWLLPETVREWITDLRQEGLLDPEARREAESPPGLPPLPIHPLQWTPLESEAAGPQPRDNPPIDLTLYVLQRPSGKRRSFDLRLTASAPGLDLKERSFGAFVLETDPAEFFRHFLKGDPSVEALRSRGSYFAEQLLPPGLRRTLSDLRHQVTTLQILSDDPWIPWEILRLDDGLFLCEAFALTRWIYQVPQRTLRLPLTRIAAVVPRNSDLPHAESEWEDLQSLAGDERQVERILARRKEIAAAFRTGSYDGWHFTGHGFFRINAPDLSSIYLENHEELTPVDLAGDAKRMGKPRPLVFLNACYTGQSGLSLTDAGGWAPCFARAGAGAFLGTLWPVRDSRSRDFARAFYQKFIGGLPFAEAVREARRAIYSEGDNTWLAYTVFGHPLAVCRGVGEK
jgi:hypothetical protein